MAYPCVWFRTQWAKHSTFVRSGDQGPITCPVLLMYFIQFRSPLGISSSKVQCPSVSVPVGPETVYRGRILQVKKRPRALLLDKLIPKWLNISFQSGLNIHITNNKDTIELYDIHYLNKQTELKAVYLHEHWSKVITTHGQFC